MDTCETFEGSRDTIDCDFHVNHLNDFLKKNGFDLPRGFFETYLNEIIGNVRDFEDLSYEWINRLDLIHDNFDEEYWKYFVNDGLTFHDDWDLPEYQHDKEDDDEDDEDYLEFRNRLNGYKKTRVKFFKVMDEYEILGWKEVV